jgi:hypothetical protein
VAQAIGTQFFHTFGISGHFSRDFVLPVGKNVVSLPRFFKLFQCDGKLKEAFL